jgi:hypothetical protein
MSLRVVIGVVAGVDFGAIVGDCGLALPPTAAFSFSMWLAPLVVDVWVIRTRRSIKRFSPPQPDHLVWIMVYPPAASVTRPFG